MERSICFEEVVIHNHEIRIEAESKELLDGIVKNVQCEIDFGHIEDKEDILDMIAKKGGIDKITFVEDNSPFVEINSI